jgi:hypothetical protein
MHFRRAVSLAAFPVILVFLLVSCADPKKILERAWDFPDSFRVADGSFSLGDEKCAFSGWYRSPGTVYLDMGGTLRGIGEIAKYDGNAFFKENGAWQSTVFSGWEGTINFLLYLPEHRGAVNVASDPKILGEESVSGDAAAGPCVKIAFTLEPTAYNEKMYFTENLEPFGVVEPAKATAWTSKKTGRLVKLAIESKPTIYAETGTRFEMTFTDYDQPIAEFDELGKALK